MCGFIVCLSSPDGSVSKAEVKRSLASLKHRGPDETSLLRSESGHYFGHTRLAIVSPEKGSQPLVHKGMTWLHNGEIYNHKDIKLLSDDLPSEESDSVAIGVAFDLYGVDFVSKLDGVFAFVLEVIEEGESRVLVARDPLGVKPLFYGKNKYGALCFASEMKALVGICTDIEIFPPGTLYDSKAGFKQYYSPEYREPENTLCRDPEKSKELIRKSLEAAVEKRLMGDVKIGSLLSGGLDSSLVAAIAAKKLKIKGEVLTTFSVGLESSDMDLEKAQLVADHIGSDHHSITYTVEEGILALREMIGLLESYDVTTIRASTPMFLMSKYIRSLGIKSVLSGEGADEIFGGYLYFAHAPSAAEFHNECLKRVSGLHQADLLRADRSTMGASVEARVPFLDLKFLEVALALDPKLKVIDSEHCEKWILRDAFSGIDLLPDEVLWRQKEQFSDGVGYEWVDGLKEMADREISDSEFLTAKILCPINTPSTKEAFLYRKIFSEIYAHSDVQKHTQKWIPKWQEYNSDPSGRANKIHDQSLEVLEEETECFTSRTQCHLAGK
jgi:asparagine synthase (glutamine-hydrolysing)